MNTGIAKNVTDYEEEKAAYPPKYWYNTPYYWGHPPSSQYQGAAWMDGAELMYDEKFSYSMIVPLTALSDNHEHIEPYVQNSAKHFEHELRAAIKKRLGL